MMSNISQSSQMLQPTVYEPSPFQSRNHTSHCSHHTTEEINLQPQAKPPASHLHLNTASQTGIPSACPVSLPYAYFPRTSSLPPRLRLSLHNNGRHGQYDSVDEEWSPQPLITHGDPDEASSTQSRPLFPGSSRILGRMNTRSRANLQFSACAASGALTGSAQDRTNHVLPLSSRAKFDSQGACVEQRTLPPTSAPLINSRNSTRQDIKDAKRHIRCVFGTAAIATILAVPALLLFVQSHKDDWSQHARSGFLIWLVLTAGLSFMSWSYALLAFGHLRRKTRQSGYLVGPPQLTDFVSADWTSSGQRDPTIATSSSGRYKGLTDGNGDIEMKRLAMSHSTYSRTVPSSCMSAGTNEMLAATLPSKRYQANEKHAIDDTLGGSWAALDRNRCTENENIDVESEGDLHPGFDIGTMSSHVHFTPPPSMRQQESNGILAANHRRNRHHILCMPSFCPASVPETSPDGFTSHNRGALSFASAPDLVTVQPQIPLLGRTQLPRGLFKRPATAPASISGSAPASVHQGLRPVSQFLLGQLLRISSKEPPLASSSSLSLSSRPKTPLAELPADMAGPAKASMSNIQTPQPAHPRPSWTTLEHKPLPRLPDLQRTVRSEGGFSNSTSPSTSLLDFEYHLRNEGSTELKTYLSRTSPPLTSIVSDGSDALLDLETMTSSQKSRHAQHLREALESADTFGSNYSDSPTLASQPALSCIEQGSSSKTNTRRPFRSSRLEIYKDIIPEIRTASAQSLTRPSKPPRALQLTPPLAGVGKKAPATIASAATALPVAKKSAVRPVPDELRHLMTPKDAVGAEDPGSGCGSRELERSHRFYILPRFEGSIPATTHTGNTKKVGKMISKPSRSSVKAGMIDPPKEDDVAASNPLQRKDQNRKIGNGVQRRVGKALSTDGKVQTGAKENLAYRTPANVRDEA